MLISGIAVLGLMGLKHSYNATAINDEDNSKKIEYAMNAIIRIDQELESDSLKPAERQNLISTRNEMQQEIKTYSKNKKNNTGSNTSILTAQLELAQKSVARIDEQLKSDTLNSEERHELMLRRANVRREIQELSQQLPGNQPTVIQTKPHER